MVDGVTYQNASSVPPQSACDESCSCVNGDVSCVEKQCQGPPEEKGMTCIEVENEGDCCPMYECVKDTENSILPESGSLQTTAMPQPTDEDSVTTIDNIEMEVFGGKDESTTAGVVSSSTEEGATTSASLVDIETDTSTDTDSQTTVRVPGLQEELQSSTTKVPEMETTVAITSSDTTTPSSLEMIETDPTSISVGDTTSVPTVGEDQITTTSASAESGEQEIVEEEDSLVDIGDTQLPSTDPPSVGDSQTTTEKEDATDTTVKVDTDSTSSSGTTESSTADATDVVTETSTQKEEVEGNAIESSTSFSEEDTSSTTVIVGGIETTSASVVSGSSEGSDTIDNVEGTTTSNPDIAEEGTTMLPITEGTAIAETTEDEIVESTELPSAEGEQEGTTVETIVISTQAPSQSTLISEEEEIEIDPVTTSVPESSSSAASDGCLLDGVEYQNFESMPSSNPCELCFCQFGEPLCAIEECPKPTDYENCTPIPPPAGICCPIEYSCRKYFSFIYIIDSTDND